MMNVNNQISRMKAMMTYDLQTENKKSHYSGVEYQREGADGKMYGIVREGTKFYIKVANKTKNVLKEDYNYIGGFRNRKDNEYTSYANALKNFEMKMSSINESRGNRTPLIESWNLDKKEMLTVEGTEKMKREIARQREIMGNSAMIQEKKNYSAIMEGDACCKVDKECANTQKNNIKKDSDGKGEPVGNGGDPYTEKVDAEQKNTQKTNMKKEYKPVMEGEEVLGWNDNEDYIDDSNGTEKVEDKLTEGEDIDSEIDDVELDDVEGEDDIDLDSDVDLDSDTDDMEDETSIDAELDDVEDEVEELDTDDETESRLSAIEDMIAKIADKLGIDTFESDELYDDDSDDEDENDVDLEFDGDDVEDSEEEYEVFESIAYKTLMRENEMDYFGKHPAYQKEPMQLPTPNQTEKEGYYDMNDDSVESEKPFGTEIGDGAPFEIDTKQITNAIAESIARVLKKKI